ncbi:MAG: ABC transporter ATP-binding protein, partial [Candidatus Rokubacteria bacterium]|nr:ABC transporter ATP-binding protein [Candidatus Rokubacteria bacterium]
MQEPLLDVRNLRVRFETPRGLLRAVDGVSFSVAPRETVGIVGESGSGKSVTMLSVLRLFPPLARVSVSGQVLFEGTDLLRLSEAELREVRGAKIGMVFQDPLTSLNPALPVGEQIAESLRTHRGLSRGAARRRAEELLELVGIPDPRRRADDLPYHFSGGMRQRIMIPIAIACEPKLLIADEPTSALDVTVQRLILDHLQRLADELGTAVLLVTHDLGVAADRAGRIAVMSQGRIVETGPTRQILDSPTHPYTARL